MAGKVVLVARWRLRDGTTDERRATRELRNGEVLADVIDDEGGTAELLFGGGGPAGASPDEVVMLRLYAEEVAS